MDEQTLIAAAQQGNLNAFNQLVLTYQSSIFNTAYRILGDREAAADATQEAFLSAFRAIRHFRGGSFKAWLLRIVTNACYDQLRARQRRPTASLDAMLLNPDQPAPGLERATAESPHEVAERHELGALIQRGLDTLPYEQRVTLVLIDIEGLSYEEAANVLATNLGTIKSRLSRARAALRDFLVQQGELVPARYRLKSEQV